MESPPFIPLGFLLADCARLLRRRFEEESRDIGMSHAQLKIVARLGGTRASARRRWRRCSTSSR